MRKTARIPALTVVLLLAFSGQAAAINAFGQWVGLPGLWSLPVQWVTTCLGQVPPPTIPGNTAACLFTVNIAGTGSDVEGDLPVTISILNLTAGATLAVPASMTSLVSTSISSGSELSIGPAATFVTGAYQNDGRLEVDLLASMTAVSLINTDRVESTGGTLALGSLVNGGSATFEIGAGLTTLATTLVENEGLFDLTASGASLTGSLIALEFDGSGEAVLGDTAATLTALGNLGNLGSHTIRGHGNLASVTTLNQGEISADAAGETLSLVTGAFDNDGNLSAPGGTLDIDATSVTHDGSLESTGATGKWAIDAPNVDNDALMVARQGGRGEIKNADLDNAGGIVSADDGSVAFEDTDIDSGQLTSTGSGFMTMAGLGLLQELTVDADLTLLPGSITFVSGTVVNQQRITLSDTAGAPGAGLFVVLDGVGTVELDGDNAILGSTSRGWTNQSQHTIEGFGRFQTFGMANNGLIRADRSGERLRLTPTAQILNRSTLQATGGGRLSLEEADVDNEGGVVEAQALSFVEPAGTTLRGGQLTGEGELRWSDIGNAILLEPVGGAAAASDVDQRVLPGGQLSLDDFVNDATVAIEGGAFLLSAGGQELWTGSGEFVLESATSTLGAPAVTQFTQGATHTIRGQGLVQGFGAHNQGTIRADQSGQTLEIAMNNGAVVEDIFNDGALAATNGATLRIDGTDIDNVGGVIEAGAGSTVAVVDAEIRGGQLTGAGGLTWEGIGNALRAEAPGVPTQSDVHQRVLGGGSQLFVEDLINDETVVVEGGAFLFSAGGQPAWTGSGEFLLESDTSTLGSALVTQFTQGPTHTIRGQGLLQGFGAYNQGAIRADEAGQTLKIVMSNGVPAADVQNDGLLLATNTATLRMQTDVDNSLGEIRADAGSIIELDEAVLRGGTLTGGGEFQWISSGTLGDVDGGTTQTDALHRITGDYLGMAHVVRMQGTVVNDGRIVVEAGGLFSPNSGSDAHFLNGSGSLELRAATSEVGGIVAGSWHQGAGHRLEGFGVIKAGAFGNSGVLAPGLREAGQEIGTLDLVIVSTDFGASAVLEIELAGTVQGTEYDFVSSSTLDLGGLLDVRFRESFETQVHATDVFTVLTSEVPLTGAFANVANGARMTTSDGRGSFLLHYGAGSLFDPKSIVLSDYESHPDFGDAPDSYQTLLASDGPRHAGGGALRLGATWDSEPDGQPNSGATGDGADEDGVVFASGIELDADSVGATQIDITASASARLDAWIDFNADGDWNDLGEQIFTNTLLAAGLNTESFSVMNAEVVPGGTFARFRLSSAGGLSPTGLAADGEVEDYEVTIRPVDNLDLMNRIENTTRTFWACNSILTGLPGNPFRIVTGATITLHAGNFIEMRSDSQVEEDALLTLLTGSVPGCP